MNDPVDYRAEISRKVFHLSSAVIPFAYAFIERELMLWLLGGCVVVAVAVEILRQASVVFAVHFKRSVGFMVRRSEWTRISGATYVLVAALLSVLLFPRSAAIAGLFILSVSDSAASLIGIRYGRTRFLGKSLAGSFAFFVTALAVLWVTLPETHGVAFLAALIATLAEAMPTMRLGRFELNDNLTIPLLTGTVVWLFTHSA